MLIGRIAISSIALGLLLLAGGVFLSEGYSAKRGFLESVSKMKVRLTADERRANLKAVPRSNPVLGGLVQLPYSPNPTEIDMFGEESLIEMERVANSFDAHPFKVDPEHRLLFLGWTTVQQSGITLRLGPVLAFASALIIIGVAVLAGALMRRPLSVSVPLNHSEQVVAPETAGLHEPVRHPRLRLALHMWGGVCVKAGADVSGLLKRSASYVDAPFVWAATAGLIAVLLIVTGYYLSKLLVSALDKASITPRQKRTVSILLPFVYFVVAILLGGVGSLL